MTAQVTGDRGLFQFRTLTIPRLCITTTAGFSTTASDRQVVTIFGDGGVDVTGAPNPVIAEGAGRNTFGGSNLILTGFNRPVTYGYLVKNEGD